MQRNASFSPSEATNGRSVIEKPQQQPKQQPQPKPAERIPIPGTKLDYANLASWWAAIAAIERHKDAAIRQQQRQAAIAALTVETCYHADQSTASKVMKFLKRNRPPRGQRHNHPTTPLLVALRNRLFQLEEIGQTAVSTPRCNSDHTPRPGATAATPNTAAPAPPPPRPAEPNGSTPTRLIFGQTASSFGRKQTKQQPAPSAQLSLFG